MFAEEPTDDAERVPIFDFEMNWWEMINDNAMDKDKEDEWLWLLNHFLLLQ
jgi:hypothetical protein